MTDNNKMNDHRYLVIAAMPAELGNSADREGYCRGVFCRCHSRAFAEATVRSLKFAISGMGPCVISESSFEIRHAEDEESRSGGWLAFGGATAENDDAEQLNLP